MTPGQPRRNSADRPARPAGVRATAAGVTVRRLVVEGAVEFTPTVFPDERGLFVTPYQESVLSEAVGHRFPTVQTCQSVSRRGVVRGVHFTATPPGQAKYVHCARGRALDFVVDLRTGSPTFGQWDSVLLDQEHFRSVYLPIGVGHAFVALEDDTAMVYLMSSGYVPQNEHALSPEDPDLALPLGRHLVRAPILSERDRRAPTLQQALRRGMLPEYRASRALDERL
ncbi:dTDP-4-dehydrorhamnose 3,5-epimerase family protein [Streptomyces avermitilis]|uniref:dTDP-4-dehydrorhamnose 3,5-epimerase family protein n=1 Tax=Streptomyces avermitilis TaxID=33903 RepID=UPI0036846216